jgi:amino acid transporter
MAEEMPYPARNVPIAMVGSVVVNGIIGFGWALMLLFSLGDLDSLLETATGFPFMQLFLNITKSEAGATVMVFIFSMTAVVANAAGLTSTSRTYWAFARDSAAPFSKYFTHVDTKLQTPVRAVVIVTVLEMLLGLIYLGNSTAFNAILSMSILGMYASYLLPIVYMLVYGRKNLEQNKYGPFRLGGFGPAVNMIAIGWLILASVFSTFPSVQPVTEQNMNYSSVVMSGWLVFGAAFFFFFGRRSYVGPNVEVEK